MQKKHKQTKNKCWQRHRETGAPVPCHGYVTGTVDEAQQVLKTGTEAPREPAAPRRATCPRGPQDSDGQLQPHGRRDVGPQSPG